MNEPPPLMRDQRKVDAEHLKLLTVFHYIGAGLGLVGIGFIALHYTIMSTVVMNPKVWEGQKGGPLPVEFFAIFKWFYLLGVVFFVVYGVLNLISAFCIRARKHRMFSIVVAGLNCIHVPLGTALGAFTIIVLLRDSVREVYKS